LTFKYWPQHIDANRSTILPHGITAHLDAVGVVNESVEDAISQGRVADLLVPT